jgi:predicted membrane protein
MQSKLSLYFILGLFIILGITACVSVGETEVETQTIELGRTERAIVELDMGAGELEVHGGARELMEATFTYNVSEWKPMIDYATSEAQGMLKIRQRDTEGIPIGNTKNKWDISLSEAVPIDLRIDMGAGSGTLDLRDIQLSALDIEAGVGELKLDISGERGKDLNVDIDGGVGSATIYLPEEIGVRVRVNGGIGSVNARGLSKKNGIYTNEAYGESGVAITIQIDGGIGSIDLKTKKSSYI